MKSGDLDHPTGKLFFGLLDGLMLDFVVLVPCLAGLFSVCTVAFNSGVLLIPQCLGLG